MRSTECSGEGAGPNSFSHSAKLLNRKRTPAPPYRGKSLLVGLSHRCLAEQYARYSGLNIVPRSYFRRKQPPQERLFPSVRDVPRTVRRSPHTHTQFHIEQRALSFGARDS